MRKFSTLFRSTVFAISLGSVLIGSPTLAQAEDPEHLKASLTMTSMLVEYLGFSDFRVAKTTWSGERAQFENLTAFYDGRIGILVSTSGN